MITPPVMVASSSSSAEAISGDCVVVKVNMGVGEEKYESMIVCIGEVDGGGNIKVCLPLRPEEEGVSPQV